MYILLTIVCLLSIFQVYGLKTVVFSDDTTFNPCGTKEGLFFYPDPTDYHKYYQCDESGIAHERSCGELVWDDLRVACNWPSAVAPPLPMVDSPERTPSWPTVSPSWPTTSPSWPMVSPSWPTVSPSWPTTSPSWPTTTKESSSTIVAPLSSLCTPFNPCGEHGKCLESPKTVPDSARRFACICSENWFGRLCDKSIDELTTSPTMVLDQNKNISDTIDTISLPVKTEKDSKLIFYGLKAGNIVPELIELKNDK